MLVEGESETGVSLHYMVAKPDAGDLVDQERVAIDSADTAFTLYGKLEAAAGRLLDRALPALAAGTAQPIAPGSARAPTAAGASRPTAASTGAGRPGGSMIWCAASPIPIPAPSLLCAAGGCWSGGRCRPGRRSWRAAPGTVTAVDRDGITVAAGEGAVRLITLQLDGQPELPACSLALAAGIAPGERLGS